MYKLIHYFAAARFAAGGGGGGGGGGGATLQGGNIAGGIMQGRPRGDLQEERGKNTAGGGGGGGDCWNNNIFYDNIPGELRPVKSPAFCLSHPHFSLFSRSPASALESQAFFTFNIKSKVHSVG